jgi:hypothetical protein
MAVGDAVAAFLGTATTNRQPSAGVEEQISACATQGTTDTTRIYDGSNSVDLVNSDVQTFVKKGNTNEGGNPHSAILNAAVMITNSIYIRKDGTTDRNYIGGVQTNA